MGDAARDALCRYIDAFSRWGEAARIEQYAMLHFDWATRAGDAQHAVRVLWAACMLPLQPGMQALTSLPFCGRCWRAWRRSWLAPHDLGYGRSIVFCPASGYAS